ncbi:hypothetical protein AAFF_G00220190 [Aldrovandia affinis]|uniref:PDZ domain-containing protein n=1 Tax=Aldrovandia affinis TaxID=143900 RepID=A0AAD7W4J4_9TELE|nr:hypothetical protein AAFF_G00220190 [Aldrovandia affinis]
MMKTESSSSSSASTSSGSTLRSPSPHRNAYEAGIQALKQVKDTLNSAANGDGQDSKLRPSSRGRRYGSNVHRIKNMFLQMGTSVPGEDEDPTKANDRSVRLSLPRASSLNENVDHSALLKLGSSVSERVSHFDPKGDVGQPRGSSGISKLQETRKIFEQRHMQEKQAATNRILLKKERASGFQDSRLDVVVRFNGSTESLDSLDPGDATEAVSPTVSQLSAVFEKADLRNNLHRPSSTSPLSSRGVSSPPEKVGILNSKIISKRARVFLHGNQEEGENLTDKEDLPRSPRGKLSSQTEEDSGSEGVRQGGQATSGDLHKSKPESGSNRAEEAVDSAARDQTEREPKSVGQEGSGGSEAGRRLVQAEVHASLENGDAAAEKEALERGSPASEGLYSTEGRQGGYRDELDETLQGEDGGEESRKEDHSEADLVDISAYSGGGEDSAGSQLEEEEEEEAYEPESSCSEVPGLPAEEEPPPSRKIRFSSGPIKVFTTYSNDDYDRRNDDVDPMAASAEYELEKRVERLDLFPVELEKDGDGLGISIIGMGAGADMGLEKLGIFVKTVTEGGAAHRDNRIQVNDLIVEVDGTSLVGVTQTFAASVLRNTTGKVRFMIGREKPGEQSEVAQLIQQTLEQERWQREMMEQRYAQYVEDEDETGEYATDEEEMSPMFPNAIEVFDLAENEDMLSPIEMDPEKLAHKFKELQIKHAVTEAEIQQLKRKLAHAEQDKLRWRMEKAQMEQSMQENKERMEKLEGYWMEAQSLCQAVDEHLKETQAQYQTLERKYSKAKRLIKEYQQKEIEFLKKETAQRRALEEAEAVHKEETEKLQDKVVEEAQIVDLESKVEALKTSDPSEKLNEE